MQINLFGLYPRIQTIEHRSQTAGGVRLCHPDLGTSPVDLAGSAFWSIQGFEYFDAQAGVVPHRGLSLPPFGFKADIAPGFFTLRSRLKHERHVHSADRGRSAAALSILTLAPPRV